MNGENRGHAWNKVKLDGNWYNWDMTNTKSDSLTMSTMGKCLKTDDEIEKLKIYKNNNSRIRCVKKPEKSLIDEINGTIKVNKRNIPKLPKEDIFSKIRQKIVNRLQNTISKKNQPLLPKGEEIGAGDKKEIEIAECELVEKLDDRNSSLFKVQAWDKGDVKNRVTTSYLEIYGLEEGQKILEIINNRDFQIFFQALLEANVGNEQYIGRIDLLKDENGELSFVRTFC